MSGTHSGERFSDVAQLFDGRRLTLARHLAGYRKNGLAEAIGKTPTSVAAYETGAKRPAPATVAQLALALGVPAEFFLPGLEAPPTTPHFRSLRSTSQVVRDQAGAYGRLAAGVATALQRHVEFPPLELPRWPVAEDGDCGTQPEEAARCLRREWSVPAGPFGHAVRATENHGIIVVFGTQESSSVDAYSFESSARPLIVLNPLKDDYFRQRFDVAHELGHLVMHAEAEPGSRIVEEQAHRFAAELLMPAGEIAGLLPARADWTKFALLKEQWGVSMQSLLFRSRRLGVMSEATYKNAMTSVSARGWRRREPGPRVAVEQPSLLPATVELLGAHGVEASALAAEARAPMVLFNCITSRTPQAQAAVESESGERRPLSLLRAEGGK